MSGAIQQEVFGFVGDIAPAKLSGYEETKRDVERWHNAMVNLKLLPLPVVKVLIGVSQSRVDQLVDEGVLVSEVHFGKKWVTEASALAYRDKDRKPGRPSKKALLEASLECGKYLAGK